MPKKTRKEVITFKTVGQKKKSPKRGKKTKVQMRPGNTGIESPTHKIACSMTSPWDCSACIPDGSTGTGCFSIKQDHTLTTGATGSCYGMLWGTDPKNQGYFDTSSAAATFTAAPASTWVNASAIATVVANYGSYRPVSAGIRCTYIGSTTSDSGSILVGSLATGLAPSALNGLTLAGCANLLQNYKIYALRNGGQITWRPDSMDDMIAWSSASVGAGNTLSTVLVRPVLCIVVFSASVNATSAIQVEAITNYEGQYIQQNFLPGGINQARKAIAEPGWYEKARNLIAPIEQILPAMATAAMASGNPYLGVLGTMANGIMASGLLSKGRR